VKTELTGHIVGLERQGDYLLLQVNVTDPVKWRIRRGLSFKDFLTRLKYMTKVSVLGFILNPKQWFNRSCL